MGKIGDKWLFLSPIYRFQIQKASSKDYLVVVAIAL